MCDPSHWPHYSLVALPVVQLSEPFTSRGKQPQGYCRKLHFSSFSQLNFNSYDLHFQLRVTTRILYGKLSYESQWPPVPSPHFCASSPPAPQSAVSRPPPEDYKMSHHCQPGNLSVLSEEGEFCDHDMSFCDGAHTVTFDGYSSCLNVGECAQMQTVNEALN